MNTTFEKYLDTIDKCLKPLPTSERVDIVPLFHRDALSIVLHSEPYPQSIKCEVF